MDIETVEVAGEYFNGPGPANSVNVNFYSNGGNNRPGSLLESRPNQTFTNGPSFSIPLNPIVSLGVGTYWVSVQANQNLIPQGQWGWRDRTCCRTRRLLAEPGQRVRHRLHRVGSPCNVHRRARCRRAGSGLPAARHRRAAASTAAASAASTSASVLQQRRGSRSTTPARECPLRRPGSLRRLTGTIAFR